MNPIRFQLKKAFDSRTDAKSLVPKHLDGLSSSEIGRLILPTDYGPSLVSDWFDIEGDDSNCIEIHGDCSLLDNLGWELDRGTLSVHGNAGHRTGARMTNGILQVDGNSGDRTAESMKGGSILISGSSGSFLGAASIGEKQGMSGGDVMVLGNVGQRACQRMRRGTIFVAGHCDIEPCNEMIGGTLIVLGVLGTDWGRGMKRGSILTAAIPVETTTAKWTEGRIFELSFLPLIWKHLSRLTNESPSIGSRFVIPTTRWAMRSVLDRSNDGRGELLVLQRHGLELA